MIHPFPGFEPFGGVRWGSRLAWSIVAILVLGFFSGCKDDEFDDRPYLANLLCIYAGPDGIPGTVTNTVTDLNNGIIQITEKVVGGTQGRCSLGVNPSYTQIYYVQKCLQGQTYQVGSNDCRGTGNAGDNYGANSFTRQSCAADNNSCETNGLATAPASPAAQACATVTAGGHSWRLPRATESAVDKETVRSTVHTLTPDIPLALAFWTSSRFSDAQGYNRQKASATSWTIAAVNKSALHNVWCFSTGAITYP